MPVEILKASVGDYSVNTGKRGVTVNQVYLGDREHSWGPALPVHQWYLKNPTATVAQVAEQLDKLPKEVTVRGYKIHLSVGDLCIDDAHLVSRYNTGRGDDCIQYLRKHYNGNKSTDVAECARLIEEYFNPSSIEVQGYKVFKEGKSLTVQDLTGWKCNPGSQKTRVARGTDCPVIAYLRTVMTKETTVHETAELIEDFLAKQEITVRGCRVFKQGTETWVDAPYTGPLSNIHSDFLHVVGYKHKSVSEVAKMIEEYEEPRVVKGVTVKKGNKGILLSGSGPHGLLDYLESKGYLYLSVAQVAKLIEDYKFTKVTVETEDGKKEFGSVNEARVGTRYAREIEFLSRSLGNRWYTTSFDGHCFLWNTATGTCKRFETEKEAQQYVKDSEIPF